jgi:hypothetical protein
MNDAMTSTMRVNHSTGERRERELGAHIFTVSAQLVGVCLTVLGLFRTLMRLRNKGHFGDSLLALDAVWFLGACILSYASLHSRSTRRRRMLERVADACFIGGLVLMTVACALIAWELV